MESGSASAVELFRVSYLVSRSTIVVMTDFPMLRPHIHRRTCIAHSNPPARLLILRAWTTVPRPLLLGYTFQSLTRYKGDRFRSWLRPSVPISKGLYTHRGNRPHISADETGLAWSEGWFGRVDSDPDPSEFSAVGRQTERVGSGTVSCEVWN